MPLPVALQVYSVRDDFHKDYEGTLKKIKEMGYDGVELAGLGSHDASEIRKVLDCIGLSCISSHVPFDAIAANPENTFAEYKILGCKYIAIPWLDTDMAPGGKDFDKVIPDILNIGKTAKENGVTLLYHNHDFEFRKIDDKYALDVLYDSIPAEYLQTQIDVCWVKVAGLCPAQYLRKYKGRAPLVHLKDFVMGDKATGALYDLIGADTAKDAKADKSEFSFKPLGRGIVDIPAVLDASEYVGANWVVVEQDASTEYPPLEAVKISREYLRSLGW